MLSIDTARSNSHHPGIAIAGAPASRLAFERIVADCTPSDGDTFVFPARRFDTEIVIGFRPGCDKVAVASASARQERAHFHLSEECGSAVITDALDRRIIIDGVRLVELEPGDIAHVLFD